MSFNNGTIPGHLHWVVAKGSPAAVRYWVLSDATNEVKGLPHRLKDLRMGGRLVSIYRFPPFPKGGVFGGHDAALLRSGAFVVVASIHGRHAYASARMAVAMAAGP
jgi:hypothetical protein